MIDFFICFFPLVKSDEQQTNCLPLMIGHAWNHVELTYALKKLKIYTVVQKFEWSL